MKNIATALVKAQREFGPALKTSTNPHFRSRYADLSACVEAVIDALNNNGIYLLQKNYDCADGIMVETVFVHESGEMLECGIVHFPATKKDPQGYASALTYGRRYSLMAACGIAPEDDDGNAASKPMKKAPIITPNQGAGNDLSKEEKDYLEELASQLVDLVNAERPEDAKTHLHTQNLENEQKLYLWSLLPSNVRSALKKKEANV
jgi:hypothetical protein